MTIPENLSVEQMWNRIAKLEARLAEHKNTIVSLTHDNSSLTDKNQYLKEQLAWFKRQLFGKHSERVAANLNEKQLTFEGFEIPKPLAQKTKEVKAHTRRKTIGYMIFVKTVVMTMY